jgi:hypothetical protein
MPPGMGAGPHLEGLLDQHHIGAGTECGCSARPGALSIRHLHAIGLLLLTGVWRAGSIETGDELFECDLVDAVFD